jgi:hypothetical protein
MRIEGGVYPLLCGRCGIRRSENPGDLRKRLVIINNGAATAEIGSDHVAKQLHQRLPVSQNARFQRVAQDRVGNNKRQD